MITVILLVVCCSLIEVSEADFMCFNCVGVAAVSECFGSKLMCGDGEKCYARKYLVDMGGKGVARFDLGCKIKTMCSTFITKRQAETEVWEYCCQGDFCNRNDEGPPQSGQSPQLPPQLPPQQRTLKTTPQSHAAQSHETVIFTCMIDPIVGTPVKMSWGRKNSVTKTTKTLSTQRVQSGGFPLVLHDVSPSDAGDYVCVTELDGKMMSAVATLAVQDNPVIKVSPTSTTASFGESVSFTCAVSGLTDLNTFSPTLTWYRAGEAISERSTLLSQQTSSGELPLNLVHVTGSNAGVYICEAVIGGRLLSARASLKINDYISMSRATPEVLHVKEGDRETIVCEASGSPTPMMKLVIHPVGMTSSFTIASPEPTIRITEILGPITRDNIGSYTCIARNSAGSREMTTWVKLVPKFSVS